MQKVVCCSQIPFSLPQTVYFHLCNILCVMTVYVDVKLVAIILLICMCNSKSNLSEICKL